MDREESSIRQLSSILSGVAARVIAAALLVLLAYTLVMAAFRFGFTVFCADSVDPPPGRDVEVTVERGETIDEFAAALYKEGVIPNEYAFRIQARLYDIGFYPGTYTLNTSMSVREIVKTINMTEQEYADKLAAEAQSEQAGGVIGGGDEGSSEVNTAADREAEENGVSGTGEEAEE